MSSRFMFSYLQASIVLLRMSCSSFSVMEWAVSPRKESILQFDHKSKVTVTVTVTACCIWSMRLL